MPSALKVHRQAGGLASQYNPIHGVPEGGLLEARNCVCDREGITGKRRGFERYGSLPAVASKLLRFNGRVLAQVGTELYKDSTGTGTFTLWGSLTPPSGQTPRSIEAQQSFFATSEVGIFASTSLTSTLSLAGMPQGLDIQASLAGTGDSWFSPDTQVGYKVVFVREDEHKRPIQGAPSFQEIVANPKTDVLIDWAGGICIVFHASHGYATGDLVKISDSTVGIFNGQYSITVLDSGTYSFTFTTTPSDTTDVVAKAGKSRDVSLSITIPDGVIAGDYLELYRTPLSPDAATVPGNSHFLLKRIQLSSAQISARLATFTDDLDPIFLGAGLETNPEIKGGDKAAHRPPRAHDIEMFQRTTFYASTRRAHQRLIQLADIITTNLAHTIGISFTVGTSTRRYVPGPFENTTLGFFQVFTNQTTTAKNIELTAKSLIRCINRDIGAATIPNPVATTEPLWHAHYASLTEDPPGKILVVQRSIDSRPFEINTWVNASGASALVWDPVPPLEGLDGLPSDNENVPNRLYHSETDRPEAVPLTNWEDIGSRRKAILRILALKNSLIVFKEDGIWRVTGTAGSFETTEVDLTAFLLAPDSTATLNDYVYCLTNQGIVRVNELGVAIISRADELNLGKLSGFPNVAAECHGVGNDSDRRYLLFAPEDPSDTYPKIAWCYNYITQRLTLWDKPAASAIVLDTDRKLYLAHATDAYVLQERKGPQVTNTDYTDEGIGTTITALDTTTWDSETVSRATVAWTYATNPRAGFILGQGTIDAKVVAVENLGSNSWRLTLAQNLTGLMATGAATLFLSIRSRLRWSPEAAGSAATMKFWQQVQIIFERDTAYTMRVGFRSDRTPKERLYTIRVPAFSGWGQPAWGTGGWGDNYGGSSTPRRLPVDRFHARSRSLTVLMEHDVAREHFGICEVAYEYVPYSTRTARARA